MTEPTLMDSTATRIFVAAKADFAIDGLLQLIKDSKDLKVVACVEPGEKCWQTLQEEAPDVLLVHSDAVSVPMHELIAEIHGILPNIRIIVFGQKMSRPFLFEIVMAGVDGYINHRMSGVHVLKAIECVMDGRLWVERIILEEMAAHARQVQKFVERSILEKIDSVRMRLTNREIMVFRFILEGMVTKEIAVAMSVSEQSVKLHLSHMFAKFNVTNRSQLILHMYSRVCPVTNMINLFRMSLDKRRLKAGLPPVISDPLARNDD